MLTGATSGDELLDSQTVSHKSDLQDSKVVDNACVALSCIADALSGNSSLLAQFCSDGNLLSQTLQLVRSGYHHDVWTF